MTAADTRNAEEVAKGLTGRERRALVEGQCGLPQYNDEWTGECVCGVDARIRETLQRKGLIVSRGLFPGGTVRSALGIEVRRILSATDRGGRG